ncbi:agmatinase [bacterium]|nr:agmatinase [bacterium]
MPIPYDGTATWQKGAAAGPEAILAASAHMELYCLETDSEPWRRGIATLEPLAGFSSPEEMVSSVREAAAGLLDEERILVGLGGEHSVSIGLIQAHAGFHENLTVLQLDAHADTRDRYEGSRFNHACVMARAAEVAATVAVGVRSLDASEVAGLDRDRVFFAHEFSTAETTRAVLDLLDGPVYVTIDLDVLDPAEMPATGTPEPGGLRYREVLDLLAEVCRRKHVVGLDVCELMPLAGNRAPDYLAARLVYQLMAHLEEGRGGT